LTTMPKRAAPVTARSRISRVWARPVVGRCRRHEPRALGARANRERRKQHERSNRDETSGRCQQQMVG
jgi:hypothetical protein